MTRIFLIRHADKQLGDYYNDRLRHQDQPISLKGRQDAQKMAVFFSDKPLTAIYVSAYQRTRQTIEHVAGEHRLTPIEDERLNEIDNGLVEGLTDEQIQESYPDIWKAYRARLADFRFPEGETGAEAQQRIVSFLQEKRRQHPDDTLLLASHDGLIRLLMCAILGLPVFARWGFQIDTCGIMEIVSQPDPDAWKLIRFNQICC